MHQRLLRCREPARPNDLHRDVVASVRAEAQAMALASLTRYLSQEEQGLVRRARNCSGRGPRNSDPAAYGRATGFEALLGWLFLHDPLRLAELLDHLEQHTP